MRTEEKPGLESALDLSEGQETPQGFADFKISVKANIPTTGDVWDSDGGYLIGHVIDFALTCEHRTDGNWEYALFSLQEPRSVLEVLLVPVDLPKVKEIPATAVLTDQIYGRLKRAPMTLHGHMDGRIYGTMLTSDLPEGKYRIEAYMKMRKDITICGSTRDFYLRLPPYPTPTLPSCLQRLFGRRKP